MNLVCLIMTVLAKKEYVTWIIPQLWCINPCLDVVSVHSHSGRVMNAAGLASASGVCPYLAKKFFVARAFPVSLRSPASPVRIIRATESTLQAFTYAVSDVFGDRLTLAARVRSPSQRFSYLRNCLSSCIWSHHLCLRVNCSIMSSFTSFPVWRLSRVVPKIPVRHLARVTAELHPASLVDFLALFATSHRLTPSGKVSDPK